MARNVVKVGGFKKVASRRPPIVKSDKKFINAHLINYTEAAVGLKTFVEVSLLVICSQLQNSRKRLRLLPWERLVSHTKLLGFDVS